MGVEQFAIYIGAVNLACGVFTSTALFTLYVITRFEVPTFFSVVFLREGRREREKCVPCLYLAIV
jgi:hypothetical protein